MGSNPIFSANSSTETETFYNRIDAQSFSGRTPDSESGSGGSNPSWAANRMCADNLPHRHCVDINKIQG